MGRDLVAIDEAICAAAPELDRWLYRGPSITMLGYGTVPAGAGSGEGDWPLIGLAPQSGHVSVYVAGTVQGESIADHYQGRMGKTNNGVGCIRFRRWEGVDAEVFARAMRDVVAWVGSHPGR